MASETYRCSRTTSFYSTSLVWTVAIFLLGGEGGLYYVFLLTMKNKFLVVG